MTAAPSTHVPTREQAIEAAAEVYLEAKLRIETERAVAALQEESGPDAGKSDEAVDQTPERGTES